MRGKKAQVAFLFTFFVAAIVILIISAFMAPIGVRINTELYLAGQDILNQTGPSINDINDATIRAQVQAAVGEAQDAAVTNIEVNSDIFQYGWVFMIILTGIIIFLYTRRTIEFGNGGLV
jgi:hypothetical protein